MMIPINEKNDIKKNDNNFSTATIETYLQNFQG